jgi:tRNA dimethylallyltransferase
MGKTVLFIGGPTASGKTALSLHAAKHLNGEIVNADSMQIYAGMETLAASPSSDEMAQAPHHLFSYLALSQRCSVGLWAEMALEKIADINARGKIAILTGGTGLYFKAMETGLAEVPEVSREIIDELASLSYESLRETANQIDADASAKIAAGDRQRLIRLVSVYQQTGQTLSSFQTATQPLLDSSQTLGIVVQPDREHLYQRIETRFDLMVDNGVLDEVRVIHAGNLDRELPGMKAVGLRPLLDHLDGEIDLETAIDLAKRDSRRYAKRQFTWFSNQHPHWARIETTHPDTQIDELEKLLNAL